MTWKLLWCFNSLLWTIMDINDKQYLQASVWAILGIVMFLEFYNEEGREK